MSEWPPPYRETSASRTAVGLIVGVLFPAAWLRTVHEHCELFPHQLRYIVKSNIYDWLDTKQISILCKRKSVITIKIGFNVRSWFLSGYPLRYRLLKLNQIRIVITLFPLIWQQTDICLVSNQSEMFGLIQRYSEADLSWEFIVPWLLFVVHSVGFLFNLYGGWLLINIYIFWSLFVLFLYPLFRRIICSSVESPFLTSAITILCQHFTTIAFFYTNLLLGSVFFFMNIGFKSQFLERCLCGYPG